MSKKELMAKIDTLIFDLDGVIVDTAVFHYQAWKRVAAELNINFSLKDNERLKGVSRVKSFDILLSLGNVKMSDQEKVSYCNRKNAWFVELISKMTPEDILPGVREFIAVNKEKGRNIVLGSASKNALMVLENTDLKDAFDAIMDGTNITSAKPDPEVFVKGAKAVGSHPENCIVFEDAVAGVQAAKNGGMYCVGIGDPELLKQADWVIPGIGSIDINRFEEKISSL
ncbi:MAG: beta-phosphoglucomutase [Bacteroidota bacterium]